MAVSLEEITEDHFHSPKTTEDQLNFLKESISKSTVYKNNWAVKVFCKRKASRKVEVSVLDPGGALKNYCELHKVQPSSTDIESMGACLLTTGSGNLSKSLQNNAEGKGIQQGPFMTLSAEFKGTLLTLWKVKH